MILPVALLQIGDEGQRILGKKSFDNKPSIF